MKFLHLSDTHIHAINNNDELQKRLDYIQREYPEHNVILTGDVTDDGSKEQYEIASKILDPRWYLCPGNHDYGVIGSFYSEEAAERFDFFARDDFIGKMPLVYHPAEGVIFICLNSNLKTPDPFDFACGEIGFGQTFNLKEILANPSIKDSVKIVCLHHHPFIHGDPAMELQDAKDFIRAIYGKVDILLFGHKHEKGRWHNKAGCRLVLASGATFQESFAWEVTVEDGNIFSQEVPIL